MPFMSFWYLKIVLQMWFPRLEVVKLVYCSAAYSQADLSCLIFDFVILVKFYLSYFIDILIFSSFF